MQMRNMARFALAVGVCLFCAAPAVAETILADNFESYAPGQNINGVNGWYSALGNDSTDPASIVTNAMSNSGSKSLLFGEVAGDTPRGVWYPFNDVTSGVLTTRFMLYWPSTTNGTLVVGADNSSYTDYKYWRLGIRGPSDVGTVQDDATGTLAAPLVYNAWKEVDVTVDLDRDVIDFEYNGTSFGTRAYSGGAPNMINNLWIATSGAAYGGDPLNGPVYVDDVSVVTTSAVPEPVLIWSLLGVLGLGVCRWRQNRKVA
jgi:hypothetical protein